MDIQCECCNSYKLNSEVKMYGKWICKECKLVENQEKQFVINELGRIHKRAEALSDSYVTSRITKITGVLNKMWGYDE